MNICVTGHRPVKLFGYNIHSDKYDTIRHAIKLAVYTALKSNKDKSVTVYSSMALGIDQIFVEEMAKARSYYKSHGVDFKIVAAVPCDSQASRWPEWSRKLYVKLLNECDEVVNVSPGVRYSAALMQKRNEYMVDHVIAMIVNAVM